MRRIFIFAVVLVTTPVLYGQFYPVKTFTVTTTAEGGSARPEVIATDDRLFVVYLGNITSGSGRTFRLKIYDSHTDSLIASKILVSTTAQYGGPTDIRVIADGRYLYAFYETYNPGAAGAATNYLWGAKYTLDDRFKRVAYTPTPITSSKPMPDLSNGGELVDDPAPLLGPDALFVITRLKYSLRMAGRTVYRIRAFSKDDLTQLSEFDLDLSDASGIDGRARVASATYYRRKYYLALPTTVSDLGIIEDIDPSAISDIATVVLDTNWTFDPQTDARIISAEPDDREHYVSGFDTDGRFFYLTYVQIASGQMKAVLKIFDMSFNLVHSEIVKSIAAQPGAGVRPSLEVFKERIYVGESGGQSLGTGNAVIHIYEMAGAPDSTQRFEDSPFGFHPAAVSRPGYPDNGFVDAQYIGVRWHRPPVYAFWFLVQPDLNDSTYDWALLDQQYGSVPSGIHILGNIAPENPHHPEGYTLPDSYLPVDEAKYEAFVRATVERYDGDGIDDMPGLVNPIKYWQVGNEPDLQRGSDFAQLQRITYQAIKEACPECTVLIGGATGFPQDYVAHFDERYAPILAGLAGQYVDAFDFHWYGIASSDYRLHDAVTGEDVLDHIRVTLTACGFPPDLPLWITEMGSYSGNPVELQFPFQSERQQAGDYLKRYVYALSRGVKKVFAAFGLMEGFKHNDGYFDHTGLIYDGEGSNDPGIGVKKLGYYTYKLMTEKLEGSNWDSVTTLADGANHVYAYKFIKKQTGAPLFVAWWDWFDDPKYTEGDTMSFNLLVGDVDSVQITQAVPDAESGAELDESDYPGFFKTELKSVNEGTATVALGKNPVFVEKLKKNPVTTLPPLLVTVVLHNEEPLGGRPDYTADHEFYLQNRELVKLLAETITSKGAAFNFQSDWNYLKAVAMFDTGSVTENTGGKNIVRWMHEDLGIEIDPHAHETQYNYADVAYLIEQLGVIPSKNVGGFLYDPPDNPQGWEKHIDGLWGSVYPSYFWRADNLWGAATFQHQGLDDASSGIWRPKDRYHFYEHDPDQRLLYIGGGCGGYPGVIKLLDDITTGRAPAYGFYTASIGVIQDWMTTASIQELGNFIDSMASFVQQGRLRWATLTQMAEIWKTEYSGIPFRYDCRASGGNFLTEWKEVWVRNLGTESNNGNRLYTRIHQPVDSIYGGQKFPAVIFVPGGLGAGAMANDLLARQGFVVAHFNAEGRMSQNPLDKQSEGVEDYNGKIHQDDLKAIVDYVLALPNVQPENVGIYTSSYGITMGAGCMGRYPDLPVKYLVDNEGPSDSKVTCFDYWNDSLRTQRAYEIFGHYSTARDSSPENIAWWSEREAVRWIVKFRGYYLRIQSEIDHAQPPWFHGHAIDMINAATHTDYSGGGQCIWTRVNGPENGVNEVYDENKQPIWLSEQVDRKRKAMDYIIEMASMSPLVSVKRKEFNPTPITFQLHQNYPNPFNPQTTIEYKLAHSDRVILQIYNLVGQVVRTLVDEHQPAGSYSVVWDGKDHQGRDVVSGIYFYQFTVKEAPFKKTKKLLLLR